MLQSIKQPKASSLEALPSMIIEVLRQLKAELLYCEVCTYFLTEKIKMATE